MQKKYKISIKIKGCDIVFNDKLGPGIIGLAEYTYRSTKAKFDSPLFAAQLNQSGQELIDKLIEIIYEESTDGRD